MFATFLLSACVHELVMVVVTHKFRYVSPVKHSPTKSHADPSRYSGCIYSSCRYMSLSCNS